MPAKYEPLGKRLSEQNPNDDELTLSFDDIEKIVGRLPSSAHLRLGWWTASDLAQGQVRAWQAAGWHVRSADLAKKEVTFARGSRQDVATAPRAEDEGGERDSSHSGRTARRWPKSDLWAWAVTVISAAVTAAIALQHLPGQATALLVAAIAAAGYAAAQAAARISARESRSWWIATAGTLALVLGGSFVYHENFDPATRPPGAPISVTVSTDPSSEISPQQCRTIVFRRPAADLVPPSSRTQSAINGWEQARNAVDGDQTVVAVALQGTSNDAAVITAPQVVIVSKSAPLRGPAVDLGGGCGSELRPRLFSINLDQQHPAAVFQKGTAFPTVRIGAVATRQAQSPVFKVSAADPEYFVVRATTTSHFVRWYLTITWDSGSRSGTLRIQGRTGPFATSSVNPRVNHIIDAGSAG